MRIMPISELRNHYSMVEEAVNTGGPVFLTKNGYGSMVVMNMEQYEKLVGDIESKLDEADYQASTTDLRYSHNEVFDSIREELSRAKEV